MKISVNKILPVVRKAVLELRGREKFNSFGLSYLTTTVSVALGMPVQTIDSKASHSQFTSGSPKKLRGPVQACLARLAREGILFSRTSPEPAVARYEHGETDKRFRFRISIEDAQARL